MFIGFLFQLLLLFPSNLSAAELEIQTTSGYIVAERKSKVLYWQDIPYAQPPVEDLRWKAPKEIINYNSIIKPKEHNYCVQRPSSLGGPGGSGPYVGSEDCLYLDIHTPINFVNKNYPVMLWIHGGGNTSGLKDVYDFSKMVKKHNVIVVRINYRLGPFGWFYHPSIQDLQTGEDKSSNFGTLDIIMALRWIQHNITKFGGDSENITIFGESAGGHNVLSLLSSPKAKGLFHKAISMSGYTTSLSTQDAYKQESFSSTSQYSSWNVVNKILKNKNISENQDKISKEKIRKILKDLSTEDFFKIYAERETYQELPLLTSDGVVIPEVGLKDALSRKEYVNNVPFIAGSNRDEVKLWLATARYFVDLDYSFIGSVLNIPKVKLLNEESFEAFNYYRSSAWKIRGVDEPISSLSDAGLQDLYAYRFDWDDHRRFVIADFKRLIGAAHATEIPLLTGNYELVGGYPLSDILYPPSFSKRYLSKNMMKFWTNFAKNGSPGLSSNNIQWETFNSSGENLNYLVLDKRKNLKMKDDAQSYRKLSLELNKDIRLSDLEKCVVLLQMFTFVGNDIYDKETKNYPKPCLRERSEKFLIDNASFIEY